MVGDCFFMFVFFGSCHHISAGHGAKICLFTSLGCRVPKGVTGEP